LIRVERVAADLDSQSTMIFQLVAIAHLVASTFTGLGAFLQQPSAQAPSNGQRTGKPSQELYCPRITQMNAN
jgi:hypothetical protein